MLPPFLKFIAKAGRRIVYSNYWQLNQAPFCSRPTTLHSAARSQPPLPWWSSWQHDEALARLLFVIEGQKRAGLLVGPAGMGKTFLLRHLRSQMPATQYRVAHVNLWGLSGEDLLRDLADQFSPFSDRKKSASENWQAIIEQWQTAASAGLPVVIMLDHFDQARPDTVPVVERLIHAISTQQAAVTFLVAARSQQSVAVSKSLLETVQLRIELQPFSLQETGDYVRSALESAGRVEPIFEPAAIDALQRLTEGTPQRINQLCELALIAGMGENVTVIDAAFMERVGQELWAGQSARA